MNPKHGLQAKYEDLQTQWRQCAISHKHHYLSYLPPPAPVDFVLVAKMTSIREADARDTPPGRHPVDPGFNLMDSPGDFILNHSAHSYLCEPGETFHLTDLAKCALPAGEAKGKRQAHEFDFWYSSLLEELALVTKPTTIVVPVGSATANFLKQQNGFEYQLAEPILHWSRAATAAAKMASSLFPEEWDRFQRRTDWADLSASLEHIFTEAERSHDMAQGRSRLGEFESKFGDVHRHYMFTYSKEMPLRRRRLDRQT